MSQTTNLIIEATRRIAAITPSTFDMDVLTYVNATGAWHRLDEFEAETHRVAGQVAREVGLILFDRGAHEIDDAVSRLRDLQAARRRASRRMTRQIIREEKARERAEQKADAARAALEQRLADADARLRRQQDRRRASVQADLLLNIRCAAEERA